VTEQGNPYLLLSKLYKHLYLVEIGLLTPTDPESAISMDRSIERYFIQPFDAHTWSKSMSPYPNSGIYFAYLFFKQMCTLQEMASTPILAIPLRHYRREQYAQNNRIK
jgi:hypothetical protein